MANSLLLAPFADGCLIIPTYAGLLEVIVDEDATLSTIEEAGNCVALPDDKLEEGKQEPGADATVAEESADDAPAVRLAESEGNSLRSSVLGGA